MAAKTKTGPMLASAPPPLLSNITTVQWGSEPIVPANGGVVTSSQSQVKDLLGLFCMVTLNLVALISNAGVMVAIARAPHMKRFALVCHLCAVDLVCAVLLMPLGIVSSSPYFGAMVFTVLECQVYIFLNVFLVSLATLTVTAISVERYFYIVHPMRYQVSMTINLAVGVMLLIWVKSGALALVTVFGWPAYGRQSSIAAAHCSLHASHSRLRGVFAVLFSVLCFLLPTVIIFAVYCSVYRVARSAALQLAPAAAAAAAPTSANASPAKSRSDSVGSQTAIVVVATGRSLPQRLSPERAFSGGKAALTLVFIVSQFLVCWLPFFIFHLHMSLTGSMQSPGDLEEAVTWLAYSSFAVNPFFYGLMNRQIREELVKFRRCCLTRSTDMGAVSHEGSLQENFLQFIQRTAISSEVSSGRSRSHTKNAEEQAVKIPGLILPEEKS